MYPTRLRRSVEARLAEAGCVAADEEAEEILGRAVDRAAVEAMVERRVQGEPLAWIVGSVAFCGLDVKVAPGVYVPRAQTEDLARRAGALLPPGGRAADLCTGSGAIPAYLRAEVPAAAVVATDVDPAAVRCARANGVAAVGTDLDLGLRSRCFDVITAVAPYVPTDAIRFLPADVQRWEPRRALDGGADGLDIVRRVVAGAARLLRPGGWLLAEIGADHPAGLRSGLDAAGFAEPEIWYDEDGDPRGFVAARDS